MELINHRTTVFVDERGEKADIVKTLDVSPDFLDQLRAERAAQDSLSKMPELLLGFSLPPMIVEMWEREGFFIEREPPAKVAARLRREGLDEFIMTSKRL